MDYNTGTWWRCDDDTITNYSGYPDNVYDDLLHENEHKCGNKCYEWIRYYCVNVIHKKRYSHIQHLLILYWGISI